MFEALKDANSSTAFMSTVVRELAWDFHPGLPPSCAAEDSRPREGFQALFESRGPPVRAEGVPYQPNEALFWWVALVY